MAQLRGLCGDCLTKPKHDAKVNGYQPNFETQEYQAYKAECQRRRLENPQYYRQPAGKPKSKKEGRSSEVAG